MLNFFLKRCPKFNVISLNQRQEALYYPFMKILTSTIPGVSSTNIFYCCGGIHINLEEKLLCKSRLQIILQTLKIGYRIKYTVIHK